MQRIDTAPGLLFRLAVAVPALVALGVSVYLTVEVLTASDGPAGCGDDAALDCEHVLSSRWSKWLGVPVSAPAAGLYATAALAVVLLAPRFPASIRRLAWSLLLALALTTVGAALWFVGLQLLVVEKLCPFCMTVHGCGMIFAGLITWRFYSLPLSTEESAGLDAMHGALDGTTDQADRAAHSVDHGRPSSIPPFVAATVVLATLVVGQWIVRQTSTAEVEHFDSPTDESNPNEKTLAPQPAPEAGAADESKLMGLMGDATFIDLNQQIILGSADAEIVAVKLFDYTCPHCRIMHHHLEAAREHFGKRLAIVLAPVPLDPACNHMRKTEHPRHVHACFYARLTRAVWLHERGRFEEFHNWLMEEKEVPRPIDARKFAEEILGPEGVEAALVDRKIELHIRKCVDLWRVTAKPDGRMSLPQLMFSGSILRSKTATPEELIEKIEGIATRAREKKEAARNAGGSP